VQAAQTAGHQVAFCASGSLANSLRERGFSIFASPSATMLGLPKPISRILEARSQSVQIPVKLGKEIGNFWMVLALTGLTNSAYLKKMVSSQLTAVKEFKPDVLFTDADPGAFITAAISGLPIAGNFGNIMQKGIDSVPHYWMEKAADAVLKENGRSEIPLESLWFGDQVLKIIPSIPELDDTPVSRPDVCFVGSLLGEIQQPDPSFEFERERRYVFVYLGTGSMSLKTAKEILPLVFPESGELRCLVGAQSITQVMRMGGVEFRPYVPADTILPFCDWTLCHGGQNTIIQSLRSGVPLLLFPGPIFERRYNARKVVQTGAGFMGEANQFTINWFQNTFQKQKPAAGQARLLAERIHSYGGAAAAIEAIQAWANK
jgi:UDP:flavonoid glycosyltransferase YjiC (YdhE family)